MRTNIVVLVALLVLPLSLYAKDKRDFTETFPLDECTFGNEGGNRYFILQPGRELHYDNSDCVEEGDCDELEALTITVTDALQDIMFDGEMISTRVVEEFETADGEFAEQSFNYFAVCQETGDVYYFGEEVFVPDGDQPGAWLAGQEGAMPGIIMPGGAFLLGARYYQEVAPGVALDRAEHTAMGLDVEVPAGAFEDCVEVTETTPLDKKEESTKLYCPNIGLVVDDDLELIGIVE
ncbi:hypothetical protein [Marinobacterium aestuariivivens]|uniref:Uncharacterized protein n=1 Tax=Marinobacterium aestuariivivens TaxID=1698799 RepID=A0ABW2A031_9GAMM